MSQLPDYVASAKPVPQSARGPWWTNIAPTFGGVMLWFLFWQGIVETGGKPGGILAAGLPAALLGVVLGALICHFLFYLVPGRLGMRTGYPLYVVGTSTYGVTGGLYMPGFLMGILQFFWVAFNSSLVAWLLMQCIQNNYQLGINEVIGTWQHIALSIAFAVSVGFIGLKGIQYVAKVATYMPIIPVVALLMLLAPTISGITKFEPSQVINPAAVAPAEEPADEVPDDAVPVEVAPMDITTAEPGADDDAAPAGAPGVEGDAGEPGEPAAPADESTEPAPAADTADASGALDFQGVLFALVGAIVGFFATAGAAGVDIASSGRDEKDVQMGGLVGIALATTISCGGAVLVVAGAYGNGLQVTGLNPVQMFDALYGAGITRVMMILLILSSFPAGCFSAFIGANSFKTTLPKVNPMISVGAGILIAIVLATTGVAASAANIFGIIGASFGPVCGAMMADYLKSGSKWAGPRAGFNLAGWISWVVGFFVGGYDLAMGLIYGTEHVQIVPCAPVAAFAVGFVLYYVLAVVGLESKSLEMPQASQEA